LQWLLHDAFLIYSLQKHQLICKTVAHPLPWTYGYKF
jgi:hypothetical protein